MGQFIGGGGGGGAGSGTVTNSGTLTNNAAAFGAGGTVVKVDPNITTDGSGNLTVNTLTTSSAGTGTETFTTGAMTAGSAGTVKIGANTGNVFSVSAGGGAVTAVALTTSPTLTTPTFSGNLGGTLQLGTQAMTSQYPNDGATGTTVNLLAKLNASGNVILPLTTDQQDIIGVCVSGCGTSSNAQIATAGEVTCIADNTVTAGDYIGVGTATAGRCKSLSAAGTYPGAGLMVVGKAQTGAALGATFTLAIDPPSQTGPISSATTTSNIVLKGNGAGSITTSSITDDGTTISTGEVLKFTAVGSAGTNTIQLNNTAGLGISGYSTTVGGFASGGGQVAAWNGSSIIHASAVNECWASTSTPASSGCEANSNIARKAIGELGTPALFQMAGNVAILTSDFTDASSASLQNITGLSFTLPASFAQNIPIQCHYMWSQATNVSDQFGIQFNTNAPTRFDGYMVTTLAGPSATSAPQAYGVITNLTTTTATAFQTFTPTTTTVQYADITGTIQYPSTAGSGTVQMMVQQSTAANVIKILAGSYCRLW